MKLQFKFYVPTDVRFGLGSRNELIAIVKEGGWKHPGIVVDHNLVDLPIVQDLIAELRTYSERISITPCRESEPSYKELERVRTPFCDSGIDIVVGIGGGSALDMAKAMAVLVNNKGTAISYRGFNQMTEPVLPIIALPTTAGTGSEITPNASFVDTDTKTKMGINGEAVRPQYAILDPELTVSCPQKPTISAAADSIVHATEAFVAKKTNAIAQCFAREGFCRVISSLPKLVENLKDINLRSEVMYGAFLSGIALMHSGTGPAAAMSYPLGVHCGVPHGIGGAIFLLPVAQLNIEMGFGGYGKILSGPSIERSRSESRRPVDFCDLITSTWNQIGIPLSLKDVIRDVEGFIKETLKMQAALQQNPLAFSRREIENVLERLNVR